MFGRTVTLVVAFAMSVGGAYAAGLQGEAMVNSGQGYKAQVGGQLKAGDSVMVRQGTTATIAYEDGCSFTLSAGRVVTVGAKSPCADGTQSVRTIDFSGRMGQSGPQEGDGGGIGPTPLIVGGVAVAVGAGVLIYNANKKDSSN